MMYAVAGVELVFAGTCTSIIAFYVSARVRRRRSWRELISMLEPADMPSLTLTAIEALNPHHSELSSTSRERLASIGGINGLARLERNANVLLALASHAERWDVRESREAARIIRGQGLALRRAAWLLRIGGFAAFPLERQSKYAQRVAVSYYEMTQLLLDLYLRVQVSKQKALNASIWSHMVAAGMQ